MTEVRVSTYEGPWIIALPDGRKLVSRRQMKHIHDVRATSIGAVDFGHVEFGPERLMLDSPDGTSVETTIEAFTALFIAQREPQKRKWWKFWRRS
jgi:hypothetical protein